MNTDEGSTFEQKGDDVGQEAGKLGAISDQLSQASQECNGEPAQAGSWITAIGKALLAIFGVNI
jgi:hypothetical protein